MRIDKDKLNTALAAKGVLVRDLHKRLNMTESTLKKILLGDSDIDTGMASKIAYVLGVRIEELEKRESETDEQKFT